MHGRLTRLHTLDTDGTRRAPRPRVRPRGIPPALERHGVFTADDPDAAATYGRDLLGDHRIRVADDDLPRFTATFHGVLVRDVTLGYLDFSTDVRIEVRRLTDDYLVLLPAGGSSTIANQGRVVVCSPVCAAVPTPGTPLELECSSEVAHVVVRIDRAALELHLQRLVGRTLDAPLGFDLAFDLTDGASTRWSFAVQMLHAELHDPTALLHRGVGHGQLEEFLMSALLFSQPSNYSDHLDPSAVRERPTVRAAREFVEGHLSEPISIGDIAAAAGVSTRTLQHHFQADLGCTVTGYLRDRRLDRVRAELADLSPESGATVTEVASRWGFTHLGRFAVMYRARFGEVPSRTLRR